MDPRLPYAYPGECLCNLGFSSPEGACQNVNKNMFGPKTLNLGNPIKTDDGGYFIWREHCEFGAPLFCPADTLGTPLCLENSTNMSAWLQNQKHEGNIKVGKDPVTREQGQYIVLNDHKYWKTMLQ